MPTTQTIDYTLYLVTNHGELTDAAFLQTIEAAIKGGVTLVQLREKNLTDEEFIALAHKVHAITQAHQVPLIIDDNIKVAQAVHAEGIHVGDADLPVREVRNLMGDDIIIGASTKSLAAAQDAVAQGADYLGVGAIYPTKTKVITKPTSMATLAEIVANVTIPVVAIGGIKPNVVPNFKGIPVDGFAVVSGIMASDDAQIAAKTYKDVITKTLAMEAN